MLKKVEIEIDDDLVHEVMQRYGLHGRREAVHLALRALLAQPDSDAAEQRDDEFDEFSDLSAWQRRDDTG